MQIGKKPTEIKIMFNWLLFNWSNLSINYGLAQISRAFGQGAKSPTRAVAALLARVKIYYNPHPYGLDSLWFGSIVAWINCGLDRDSALNIVLLIRGCKFIGTHIVKQWQIVFNWNIVQLTYCISTFVQVAFCSIHTLFNWYHVHLTSVCLTCHRSKIPSMSPLSQDNKCN